MSPYTRCSDEPRGESPESTNIGGALGGGGAGENMSEESMTLRMVDGTKTVPESLSCIYRQSTGVDDALTVQLQYLGIPGHVAFAVYL